jgi:hypothetical protein
MSFSGTSFSGKSFHLVATPGEVLQANISGKKQLLNISGEVKEVEYKAPPNQLPQLNIISIIFTTTIQLTRVLQQTKVFSKPIRLKIF